MKTKMMKIPMTTVCAAALVLGLATAGRAVDHSAMGHEMPGMTAAASANHGAMIREATAGGYKLMYHLLNWKERNEAMKGMEGMKMAGMDDSGKSTNHLMLYVTTPDGKEVGGGKVGFQVTRPDGGEQKTLTMAMGGGYGADLIMKEKGVYKIMSKIVVGKKTTVDEFTYEVK